MSSYIKSQPRRRLPGDLHADCAAGLKRAPRGVRPWIAARAIILIIIMIIIINNKYNKYSKYDDNNNNNNNNNKQSNDKNRYRACPAMPSHAATRARVPRCVVRVCARLPGQVGSGQVRLDEIMLISAHLGTTKPQAPDRRCCCFHSMLPLLPLMTTCATTRSCSHCSCCCRAARQCAATAGP